LNFKNHKTIKLFREYYIYSWMNFPGSPVTTTINSIAKQKMTNSSSNNNKSSNNNSHAP